MSGNLTQKEVDEMLEKLKTHFDEPVLPMSKFCDAISNWFRCIIRNNTDPELVGKSADYRQGNAYYKYLSNIEIDIRKSNLLARLLYDGEELRTEICPNHKGHWDGQAQLFYGCIYGCGGTGWLPNDLKVRDEYSWVLAKCNWVKRELGPEVFEAGTEMVYPGKLLEIDDFFKKEKLMLTADIRLRCSSVFKDSFYAYVRLDKNGPTHFMVPGLKFNLELNGEVIIEGHVGS